MKKIIFLFAFTAIGFFAVNAQNGVTKPAAGQSVDQAKPAKAEVKEEKKEKKENCTTEEQKKCGKKAKGCCAHKSETKS
jgi:hypothetical protein